MLAGGGVQPGRFFRDRDGYWAIEMDAGEVLDNVIDWTGWLAGDTIATSGWAVENITKNADTNSTTAATVWLSGAARPRGKAVNTIVTAGGRTTELTLRFYCKDK